MPDRPGRRSRRFALDPACRVYLDGDRLILVTLESATVLRGSDTPEVIAEGLALLDGTRSQDEIAQQLRVPLPDWDRVVEQLMAAELAAPAEDDGPSAGLHRLVDTVVDSGRLDARPTAAPLVLTGSSTPLLDEIGRAWVASGGSEPVRLGEPGLSSPRSPMTAAPLVVAAVTTAQETQRLNVAMLQQDRPWMLVEPYDGEVLTVGPVMLPGQTCCAECVRLRRAAHAPYGGASAWSTLVVAPRLSTTPAVLRLQADLVTLVAAVHVLRPQDSGVGIAHSLDPRTMQTAQHRVLRVPRCPACSPTARRALPFPWTRTTADVAG